MRTRKQIRKEIAQNTKAIDALCRANLQLRREDCLLNDETQRYEEKIAHYGRGKTKHSVLEGRIYWTQRFKDTDTGGSIAVERSRVVKVDGEWTGLYRDAI